jgi:hypothetical protein
MKAAYSVVL